jgi:RNA polymerase sigma-70 factor (ECF subfamily)
VAERDDLARALAAMHAASYGWALACCGRRADEATDVLQDAYAKVLTGRARFDGRSSLKTWFFGVVRWTALEHRRSALSRWLLPRHPHAASELATKTSAASADESVAERERAAVIAEALLALSPRQREVVHLVFYEDMTLAEAAAIMGVSLGTARLHYDRGKTALHEILVRRGVSPS